MNLEASSFAKVQHVLHMELAVHAFHMLAKINVYVYFKHAPSNKVRSQPAIFAVVAPA
jgi:hypothetical protein